MADLRLETLQALVAELDGYPWREEELSELVDPKRGIISGFADLLAGQAAIRRQALPGLEPEGPAPSDESV